MPSVTPIVIGIEEFIMACSSYKKSLTVIDPIEIDPIETETLVSPPDNCPDYIQFGTTEMYWNNGNPYTINKVGTQDFISVIGFRTICKSVQDSQNFVFNNDGSIARRSRNFTGNSDNSEISMQTFLRSLTK